jgi:putative ABC transport system permease protein
MNLFGYLRSMVSSLFHRSASDRELDEEIRSHLARQTEDLERSGLTRAEAERRARIAFGSTEKTKEAVRETRPGAFLDTLGKDMRFAVRMLQKNPGFTTVAVFTLALGIGANTAIFSIVDTTLLRPLPYHDPAHLVSVVEHFPSMHNTTNVLSPDFLAWQQHNQVFAQIEAFDMGGGANLTGAGEPRHINTIGVSPGFFSMLGIQPLVGRHFLPSEAAEGKNQVVLISESLWRSQFASDTQIFGRTIHLDGDLYTIVGVLPATVRFPAADMWTPFALNEQAFSPQSPSWHALTVVGRLKSGVQPEQARSDLQVVTEGMKALYPVEAAHFRDRIYVEVVPLRSLLVHNVRALLWILFGAVGFILLIACANVANLLMSRGVVRTREMAVRATLGASRARLIRQMVTEAFLLAAAGGVIGLILGLSTTGILRQLIPDSLPSQIHLDPRILAFSTLITVLVVLVFGLIPAFAASRPYVSETLKAGSALHSPGRAMQRMRAALTAFEIALSLILLVGAGLLVRSFLRVSEVNLGFQPHGVLVAGVGRAISADNAAPPYAFFQDLLQRAKALPGVTGAAVTTHIPLQLPNMASASVTIQGGPQVRLPTAIYNASISPEYFRTLNVPQLKGRDFRSTDSADAPPVVILNDLLAQGVFGTQDPIGRYIRFGDQHDPWKEVVGVVSNTVGSNIEQAPMPEAFVPYWQEPSPGMSIILRTEGEPETLASSLRAAVESMDENQPLSELTTMDDIIAKTIAPRRFKMQLLGLFAMLALVLAAVGIYGLMSYSVQQRTHEIGVRNALGASPGDILGLIIAQGFRLTVFGILAGIAGALALTRYMASLLFGINERDPFTFAAVVFVLSAVALVACYIPARRAATVDPMVALRHE